ncbi:hypothetical protein HYX14_04505 [Candidatus Woesearchaeota archaeon]|nr:hypothetical protein [Candidatus Woesearchaeota archaeon]
MYQQPLWVVLGLFFLGIWSLIWQGIGLWHAARNKQKGWFMALLLVSSLGFLPIIYLIWFKPRDKKTPVEVVEIAPKPKKKKK